MRPKERAAAVVEAIERVVVAASWEWWSPLAGSLSQCYIQKTTKASHFPWRPGHVAANMAFWLSSPHCAPINTHSSSDVSWGFLMPCKSLTQPAPIERANRGRHCTQLIPGPHEDQYQSLCIVDIQTYPDLTKTLLKHFQASMTPTLLTYINTLQIRLVPSSHQTPVWHIWSGILCPLTGLHPYSFVLNFLFLINPVMFQPWFSNLVGKGRTKPLEGQMDRGQFLPWQTWLWSKGWTGAVWVKTEKGCYRLGWQRPTVAGVEEGGDENKTLEVTKKALASWMCREQRS